jgi:predicted nucleotidyltransferase
MVEELRRVLDGDPRIAFARLFGSHARDTAHARSDIDVAIGLAPGHQLDPLGVGDLLSKLEAATGSTVDVVLLDQATPGLAYRILRDLVSCHWNLRNGWRPRRDFATLSRSSTEYSTGRASMPSPASEIVRGVEQEQRARRLALDERVDVLPVLSHLRAVTVMFVLRGMRGSGNV